jgi:hypothetical protein
MVVRKCSFGIGGKSDVLLQIFRYNTTGVVDNITHKL